MSLVCAYSKTRMATNHRQISAISEDEDDRLSESEEQLQSEEIIENADVEFEVEGNILKAVKVCLSLSSPVFKAMFKDDFKEKTASKIPLPGKAYADVLEFIEVTHSGRCVDGNNAGMLLPLAHEYNCRSLMQRCEEIFMNKRSTFDQLAMAGKYGLQKLQEKCINNLLDESHCKGHDFKKIDSDTKVAYLERKLQHTKIQQIDHISAQSSTEHKLLAMQKKLDKIGNVINKNIPDYVCCARDLDRFLGETAHSFFTQESSGDHVAGSQEDFCITCAAFKYFAILKVFNK